MTKKIIAIVDPYSSGAMLVPEFDARGYRCLAVQSSREVPLVFRSSFRPDQFIETIQHKGNIEETLEQLKVQDVQFVVGGCELGLELADQLSEGLGLSSNGTKYSTTRRDKFLMLERVRETNLSVPRQFKSSKLDDVTEWIASHCSWPVIIKPTRSFASDCVSLCATDAEVEEAFGRIMNEPNKLGLTNTAVLVQEFLQGTEYVVDTVSIDGLHRVAAFWRYSKPTGKSPFVCYDCMEFLQSDGPIQDRLFSYATAVLDALEIRNGPAHCEIIWVDDAPVLVEVGARLTAPLNAIMGRMCSDICQLDLAVEAYLKPKTFLARQPSSYGLTKRAANFFLMPKKMGRLKALPRLQEIEQLPSFHKMSVGVKPGDVVSRVIGVVTLIHTQRDVLQDDIVKIRRLEEDGFYELESSA